MKFKTSQGFAIAAFILSSIAIMLWFCKYEPTTWGMLDVYAGLLSLAVSVMAVLFGYNVLQMKKEVRDYVDLQLKEVEKMHGDQATNWLLFIEPKFLQTAKYLDNSDMAYTSILSIISAIITTKNKYSTECLVVELLDILNTKKNTFFSPEEKKVLIYELSKITSLSSNIEKVISLLHKDIYLK